MKKFIKSVLKKINLYDFVAGLFLEKSIKGRVLWCYKAISRKKEFSVCGYVPLFSNKLVVTHNAGFFSCCSIRLQNIIEFYNYFNVLPAYVDSKNQFLFYKKVNQKNVDITKNYFVISDDLITVEKSVIVNIGELQFQPYNQIEYKLITPFVDKYFTLNKDVMDIAEGLFSKNKLDYSNLCCICYRGNDKAKETNLPKYEEIYDKAIEIKNTNPNVRFLVQTDEKELYEYFDKKIPNYICSSVTKPIKKNSNDGVHFQKDRDVFEESVHFLAALKVISNCKHEICTSSNVWLWMLFLRRDSYNVHQYLSHKKEINGRVNPKFSESCKKVWYP